jgi:hypothetical protein
VGRGILRALVTRLLATNMRGDRHGRSGFARGDDEYIIYAGGYPSRRSSLSEYSRCIADRPTSLEGPDTSMGRHPSIVGRRAKDLGLCCERQHILLVSEGS